MMLASPHLRADYSPIYLYYSRTAPIAQGNGRKMIFDKIAKVSQNVIEIKSGEK